MIDDSTRSGHVDDSTVYLRVRTPLMRFATALVGADDAADVLSAVVLRTLETRSLSSLDNPQTYLMKAVLNEARARARSQRRLATALGQMSSPISAEDSARGDFSDLVEAVMALPVKQRAAVYAVYWMGMSSQEAAQALGCRAATVRRYLHLARRKLERFAK